ncbi:hypothetical protein RUMCAL_01374 [Ruminococcus callidus ATCC 27760]|uniref:Uncharacterized protein n=1 Tax=Ruminococcus callidus ATCC 27760 TaxID=411473 RepID=U2M3A6_9FIRM|nr:hypothetical protein RUMCAL_01374 [Ruminococcus callidus ATCC 27760]
MMVLVFQHTMDFFHCIILIHLRASGLLAVIIYQIIHLSIQICIFGLKANTLNLPLWDQQTLLRMPLFRQGVRLCRNVRQVKRMIITKKPKADHVTAIILKLMI